MITIIKSIISLIYKAIMAVVNALTTFLLYFGLYVPFLYIIYTSLLMIFCNLSVKTLSVQSIMYYIGLIISIFCSLIITYKKLKGNNVRNYNDGYIDTRPPERRYRRNYDRYYGYDERNDNRYRDRPNYRYNDYNNRNDYNRNNNLNYDVPIVKRHSKYPGIVLYEYSNRIEYYGDNGRKQLVYLKTQYKR